MHNQISTDQVSSVSHSPGTVMSFLQPTPMIPLAHGKGRTTSLSSTVVVTITETPASEAPDVSAPIVNVVFHSGWKKIRFFATKLNKVIGMFCTKMTVFENSIHIIEKISSFYQHEAMKAVQGVLIDLWYLHIIFHFSVWMTQSFGHLIILTWWTVWYTVKTVHYLHWILDCSCFHLV